LRALIIDDQPLFMKKMVQGFNNSIDIGVAKDGKEGLNAYFQSHKIENPYDVIFLDLEMPIIRGEQLLTVIRCYEDTMGIENSKIIVTSAHNTAKKAMELFKGGCEFYLKKPIVKAELEKAVAFVFKGQF
jgi:CheY-like chemotaxis protein